VTQKLTFGIGLRPQHASWAEQAAQWPKAEAMGFDSIWLNDHFHSLGDSIDKEAFEASTTLAAVALSTSRVKIGVLTYGNTHRIPTILAKQIVTIDHMSGGGRVILGIGTGWNEPEHAAYAIPLPSAGERVARLEEALEIFKLLETNDRTNYQGKYYTLVDAPFEPKPVKGRIPILIGGTKPKMLRVIGKYADIWDSSLDPDEYVAALKTIREHARDFGRDPESIVASKGVWSSPVSDKEFANKVRAAYKAGVRQILFRPGHSREGLDDIPRLMQDIVPELKAELDR
jgi:alkanesulfonate monooxygenase SsuD/methylene tetrahydromethanopterin reductase-like flavin-dependent oxidoreductase (luciferase family)